MTMHSPMIMTIVYLFRGEGGSVIQETAPHQQILFEVAARTHTRSEQSASPVGLVMPRTCTNNCNVCK